MLAAETIHVSNAKSNDVPVIDVTGHEVVKPITVGQAPWGIAVVP